jgi:hypothetical protein
MVSPLNMFSLNSTFKSKFVYEIRGSKTEVTLISGFGRDVDEICPLLGYYEASCGNCLPTFRDNVSIPSSRVKSSSRKERKRATYNVDSGKYVRGSNP